MPYFEIDEFFNLGAVMAVMNFPFDKGLQKKHRVCVAVQHADSLINRLNILSEISKTEPDRESLDFIWRGLQHEVERFGGMQTLLILVSKCRFQEQLNLVPKRGLLAGRLVQRIVQLKRANINPSQENAIKIVRKEVWDDNYWNTSKPLLTSKSQMKKCWADFKSVAHLWAAYEALCTANLRANNAGEFHALLHLHSDGILPYLSFLSRQIFQEVALITVKGQKTPILTKDDVWMFPDDFHEEEINWVVPPLEDWALEALNR